MPHALASGTIAGMKALNRMRLLVVLAAAAIAGALAGAAVAGQYNPKLSIDDPAPRWSALPGVDGKRHSAADLPADKLVVVVFTCNSCPVARDYEDRLIALAREHAEHLRVVAINVNTIPEDRLEAMRQRSTEQKFNFPYLYDESQQIARDFGASGTPESFLLSRVHPPSAPTGIAGERTVLYMGAFDDNANPQQVTRRYLEEAVQAALAGAKADVAETFATGCRIRFARRRRPE
jgi:peroxiredoxin